MTRLIDREAELRTLVDFVHNVASGIRGVAVVEGSAGMGKSILVQAIESACNEHRGTTNCRFVHAACFGGIGAEFPFGPFLELLRKLSTPPSGLRRWFKLGTRVATDVTPELLQLVPAVGPVLKTGATATKSALESGAWRNHADALRASGLSDDPSYLVANAILNVSRRDHPLILVIDDAHRIDASSCIVLDRLMHTDASQELGICLAYRPELIGEQHPLRDLLDKLRLHGLLHTLSLAGFRYPDMQRYVVDRFGVRLREDLSDQLWNLTNGHPLFVAQYLSLLDERNVIRRAERHLMVEEDSLSNLPEWWERSDVREMALPTPESVQLVIRERIRSIDAQTRDLLYVAAIQGESFISSVVQMVSEVPREEVLTRLHRASAEFGATRLTEGSEWTHRSGSDSYSFSHSLIHEAFYNEQSPQLRRDRHALVADALQRLIQANPDVPRETVVDLARHRHLAGQVLEAARQAYEIARSFALEGAHAECIQLCRRALEDIRQADPNKKTDKLHAEIIELFLASSEFWWRGKPELQSGLPLLELAVEAAEAAERTGDLALCARILLMRGKVCHKTRTIGEAVEILSTAQTLARRAGDAVSEFMTTAEYGHVSTKVDLQRGLRILTEAESMFYETPELRETSNPVVLQSLTRVELQLGINSFDAGDFGEAQRRIETCLARMRRLNLKDELPDGLNYAAQLHIAMGALDRAEDALKEAVNVQDPNRTPLAWHGYNLALLGKLKLEQQRVQEALALVQEGWAETEQTWLADLVPLVRNFYAEILLEAARGDPAQLQLAERMLIAALEESRSSELTRSEVAALSLLARLHLMRGDFQEALLASQEAVGILDRVGAMPALRTEEVLYRHAVILDAAGDSKRASAVIRRAWQEIERKSASIPNREDRYRFREKVTLNRQVRDALERIA